MPIHCNLILAVPPDLYRQAQNYHLPIAHMAYRLGCGPHLFRSGQPFPLRGGLMAMDDKGFDGRGDPSVFCREVLQECAARQFTGVLCDFEGRHPALTTIAQRLSASCRSRGLSCYLPEHLGHCSDSAGVLISTALSGGSLKQRLEDAVKSFGIERVIPAIERTAMDFFLPSPTGHGMELTRQELQERFDTLSPSVFFSSDLCARYFTYMSHQNGAHFVLFDDAVSIRHKLSVAQQLGLKTALMAFPQVDDLLPEILA